MVLNIDINVIKSIYGLLLLPISCSKARDIGFFVFDTVLTPKILFIDIDTNTYNTIVTINDVIIALGIFFLESLVSSANLGIVSNPL